MPSAVHVPNSLWGIDLWDSGNPPELKSSVQLGERKNDALVPKRHQMKHLEF